MEETIIPPEAEAAEEKSATGQKYILDIRSGSVEELKSSEPLPHLRAAEKRRDPRRTDREE